MLVNVYAAKYDLPADFDPNTMNKYDYPSTDMSTAYLMHVAADGSTIANVDLSVTDDGTDEEGWLGQQHLVLRRRRGGQSLRHQDYNYIYVLDAEGKLLFKIDDSQYSGSLCRRSPIRSVSCGTTTPPAPRRAPTRTASSSSPSILRRRPGARRSRCRPTSGTSIRATTPTISITRTTTTSMATPSRAIRRTSRRLDGRDVDTSNMYDSGMLSDGRVVGMTQDWSSDTTTYQLIVLHALTLPRSRKRPS